MAEVNLHSCSEISQAFEGLQLNSTAATLEHILARFARLETRLVEHERRVAATLPQLQPEPDPPDRPRLYAAAQPPHQPYQPPLPPHHLDGYPPHNRPWSTTALGPQPYPTWDPLTLHRNPWSMPHDVEVSTNSAPPTPPVPMSESYHYYPSPAVAVVRQPPQLREPSSWFNVPQHQVLDSTPTYIASAMSPTAPTQSPYCHGQPIVVLQPQLSPLSHCQSAATLPTAAPPPSSLPADNTPTMVFGEDVSDGIVPNIAIHNVGATLDVPNDKVLEEIVKNDEESPQVLVKATTEKNMMYDDKNLPQVSILMPLLNRGAGSLPIRKEVREIFFQDGVIMFRWISGGEYIQSSRQAGHRGIGEGRCLIVRCAFDPGGESSPKLLFASLFVVSWFPP